MCDEEVYEKLAVFCGSSNGASETYKEGAIR